MRLVSISIEKYRSITRAHKIRIDRSTILVGPNNEGKSNVLRALVAAMNILTREPVRAQMVHPRRMHRHDSSRLYNWEHDYPLHLQGSNPKGQSSITLEFELDDEEIQDFKNEIRSNLNGTLPLKISIGAHEYTVKVAKKGPGGPALSKKSKQIASFVAARLQFEHIPAVRTAQSAQNIVEELVARELSRIESNPEYDAALAKVGELQQPVLDQLSENIKSTLITFLPAVRDVKVTISAEDRYRAMRRACSISVDDGTATLLRFKGDGVQSLAALGIMRHASETTAKGRNLVVAIEEPESHLHPNAIHELKAVLDEMSNKQQIVLTTHNPLFVDRVSLKSNIIVNQRKARPAKSIREIREILGVRASDNLRNAELVLVVEGEDDRVAVQALLGSHSKKLRSALDDGRLGIDTLQGGTNLAYKLGLLRTALCSYHCFLDDDGAGRESFERARVQGLVVDKEVHLTACPGRNESELEDLYDPDLYKDMVSNSYGVSLSSPRFRGTAKWSARIKAAFRHQGKPWNDRLEMEVKKMVAELAAATPKTALHSERRGAFDALVAALDERLDELHQGRSGT